MAVIRNRPSGQLAHAPIASVAPLGLGVRSSAASRAMAPTQT